MKKYLIYIVLGVIWSIKGQESKPVIIDYHWDYGFRSLYAYNNTDLTYEVTVTLKDMVGFKEIPSKVITKLVPPQDSLLIVKLVYDKKRASSVVPKNKTGFTYHPKINMDEQKALRQKMSDYVWDKKDDINKGIVVFDKPNKSRSTFTLNYLIDKNIPFKWIELPSKFIKNNKKKQLKRNQKLFNSIIKKNDFKLYESLSPVYMINGKLTYSLKDLYKNIPSM